MLYLKILVMLLQLLPANVSAFVRPPFRNFELRMNGYLTNPLLRNTVKFARKALRRAKRRADRKSHQLSNTKSLMRVEKTSHGSRQGTHLVTLGHITKSIILLMWINQFFEDFFENFFPVQKKFIPQLCLLRRIYLLWPNLQLIFMKLFNASCEMLDDAINVW